MTAALLIGVGTVATSQAAGEKNRGPRKGAHVKKEGGAKAHAQQGGRKVQISRRVERIGKPQPVRKTQRIRGPQVGPPAHIRDMWQKRRQAAQRSGRGPQGGPPEAVERMRMVQKRVVGSRRSQGPRGPQARGGNRGGARREHCGSNKRGGDRHRGGRKEHRNKRGHRR